LRRIDAIDIAHQPVSKIDGDIHSARRAISASCPSPCGPASTALIAMPAASTSAISTLLVCAASTSPSRRSPR